MTRTCSDPGCARPFYAKGLCQLCYQRDLRRRQRDGRQVNEPEILVDEIHMACPGTLEALAGCCAELDARAIVRAIWPHLLEASLAGVEPFTMDEAS